MIVTHQGVQYVFCMSSFDPFKKPLSQACYRCGGTEWDHEVLLGFEVGTLFKGQQLRLHRKCMTYSERLNWESE